MNLFKTFSTTVKGKLSNEDIQAILGKLIIFILPQIIANQEIIAKTISENTWIEAYVIASIISWAIYTVQKILAGKSTS